MNDWLRGSQQLADLILQCIELAGKVVIAVAILLLHLWAILKLWKTMMYP